MVTCAQCGEEFESGWSDEEAEAELKANFPDATIDECALVCTECYQEIMKGA